MSEQFREQLSALMDGELPRDEVRFLLRRIDGDTQLAQAWTRYQLAGGVLRRQAAVLPLRGDFADVLVQRLGAAPPGYGMRMLRWAGGGAIAAAVAVVALVSTRPLENPQQASATLAVVAPVTAAPVVAQPLPMQPSFDFAQPASFDTGVIPLPRYRHELGLMQQQDTLGPYVLLTIPPPAQEPEALAAPPPQ
jgi:sigma-E factor negative regulatory protein RseA